LHAQHGLKGLGCAGEITGLRPRSPQPEVSGKLFRRRLDECGEHLHRLGALPHGDKLLRLIQRAGDCDGHRQHHRAGHRAAENDPQPQTLADHRRFLTEWRIHTLPDLTISALR
jgi:hypothetical protein